MEISRNVHYHNVLETNLNIVKCSVLLNSFTIIIKRFGLVNKSSFCKKNDIIPKYMWYEKKRKESTFDLNLTKKSLISAAWSNSKNISKGAKPLKIQSRKIQKIEKKVLSTFAPPPPNFQLRWQNDWQINLIALPDNV